MLSAELSVAQHPSKFSQQNKLCTVSGWGIAHLQAVNVHKTQLETIYHLTGLVLIVSVAPGWHTLVRMSVAKATSFHNKIIDGIMVCVGDGGSRVFGQAGTRLALQQTDSQVGDHKLVLGGWSIRIHHVPEWQSSIDHLEIRLEQTLLFNL